MQKMIVVNRIKIDRNMLRLWGIAVCAAVLCIALPGHLHFALQLFVYLLALWLCRDRLRQGLEALSGFAPTADTLLLLSAFAALLHGIATVTVRPYYAYAALSLAFAEGGRELERRRFGSSAHTQPITARIYRIAASGALLAFALTFTIWLALDAGVARAATYAATAVIVFCPVTVGCILPLCNIFAAKIGEKYGVLLQNADAPVKMGQVNALLVGEESIVYADEPALYDVYSIDADKTALLAIAAAIEQQSAHPFAEAIILAAAKLDLPLPAVDAFVEFRGKGVTATVAGDQYFLGNKKFFRENGILLPDGIRRASLGGRFPLYVAKNGCFCGMLLLSHKEKEDVTFIAHALSKLFVRSYLRVRRGVILLTGDKEKVLQEPKNNATIKMMLYSLDSGEKADAFCTASVTGCADVLLPHGDLYAVYCAILLGRKVRAVLLSTVAWTVSIGVLILAVALGALYLPFGIALTPENALLAAAIMLAAAVFNTLRLYGFVPPQYTPSEVDDMFGKVHYTMKIEGMSCAHCSARVKTALEMLRGTSAEISLEEKVARVKCPASLSAETLTKAVEAAGYTVLSCERV